MRPSGFGIVIYRKNKVDEINIHSQLHSSKFRVTLFTDIIGASLDLHQLE